MLPCCQTCTCHTCHTCHTLQPFSPHLVFTRSSGLLSWFPGLELHWHILRRHIPFSSAHFTIRSKIEKKCPSVSTSSHVKACHVASEFCSHMKKTSKNTSFLTILQFSSHLWSPTEPSAWTSQWFFGQWKPRIKKSKFQTCSSMLTNWTNE